MAPPQSCRLLHVLYFAIFALCNAATTRPNFIFILTDDQDLTLDSMQAMPNTLQSIANEGITFNNTFISTPICCPSRTETISGRNFQNIKNGPIDCMNIAATYNVFNNTHSMFQIFHSNGYLTGSFGKLTNNMPSFWCDSDPDTTGFSRVHCPCEYNNFYGQKYFDKYMNGSTDLRTLPVTPELYQTSMIGNASIQWLKEVLSDDPQQQQPFLMWIGPHAPHYPATPAVWYADKYSNTHAPHSPNWNVSDSKKHAFVGTNPSLTANASGWIDQLYRDRLRTLLSVDDLVADVMNLLNQYPSQLDNTYILFTSDHGYHLGQYDVPCSKQQPYEETIRIPMYLRGPNVPKKKISYDIVGNIDILPTFLSLAGVEYDDNTYDGRSWTTGLLSTREMDGVDAWNRSVFLTQYQSVGTYGFSHCQTWFPSSNGSVCPGELLNPPETNPEGEAWLVDDQQTNNWRAIRIMNETMNMVYAEFVNHTWNENAFEHPQFYEYYDLNADPFQLRNAYDTLTQTVKKELHDMLMQYGSCSGTDCW